MTTTQNIPWHNPNNLTDDQVGVSEGWRLLTVDEIVDGPIHQDAQLWKLAENWGVRVYPGNFRKADTYRTRAPLPEKYRAEQEPDYASREYQKSVLLAEFDGQDTQWSLPDGVHWLHECNGVEGVAQSIKGNMRVRIKPQPAPVKMVPLEAEDIPALCWLSTSTNTCGSLIVGVGRDGIDFIDEKSRPTFATYEALMKWGQLYSTDRKTWQKCEKAAKEGV